MQPELYWRLLIYGGALIIIAALAVYAWLLRKRLHEQQQQQQLMEQKRQALYEHRLYSIRVLATTLIRGELNASEAAIRLCILLEVLLEPGQGAQQYPGIYQLHDAVAEMPRGKQREKVARQVLMKLDLQRQVAEHEHQQAVLAEAQSLLERFPAQ